ncbi:MULTISPECIES: putative bifunctional diguanylate cyclase/phosphodiesterase [Bradyrhizobium]|uniref:Blr2589 protein n=1 Tax=Bradyrhizobium diazoefficiens (strain JCM 10833 / BCRC 13528 / IAM 13628 / NBRC 14792 / USDA 110) TaxID=224911 RepID=Q89S23_BRADU|nr:EAL domain-containing protein [Bradyrhizobium diazoefficiens]MBP1058548.1 diguanylate cyclase (GGDEF)-like protein/PAS domain S-box-containing protein [Bradyrhizobium japonicum]AND88085.1 diguanylate cyclase [Bradyrhizobium diazoefficiens USDA 110]AWO89613.1 EAL domain-containing protein [Bradyrhizobium diazoefficiens]PDT63746.1 GGDEF domain-containing protein [Bradyrhizobium diazoefficiens]QBP21419.1 EAL domain-containing protein [Bradyrhizobium diazoefficiens]
MSMHRLFAEQLRCATGATGQVDVVKLGELVSAAYEANERDRHRVIDASAHTHDEVEQDLLRTREFLDTIVENIPIAVFAKCAKDSRYILLNRAGEDYYGLPREQMLGRTPEEIFPADVARVVNEQDRRVVDTGEPMFLEGHLLEVGVNGHDRVVNSRKLLIRDGNGTPQYVVGVIEDVTEQLASQARISHLAHHDALTDLPNRSAFNAELDERLELAQEALTSFAVLSLDLDRFKEVNDVFGHPVGDMLMRAAADRLAAEADGAFVARIGGDEFMILMPDNARREDMLTLAERLVEVIGKELEIDDYLSQVGVSVGIAVYPDDGVDAATLLANADSALYRAKREGRARVRFFESETDQELRDRRLLQHDLRQALEQNQFLVHFQPQARMDGEVIGFEALLRWNHPTRGFVPPDRFIPLAEENGLIVQIGEWVLREACREAASWPRPLQVAVNLSPVQVQAGDLERSIHQILLETGLAPTRLEVEITEGVLIGDFTRALNLLRRLKALGIRIAMDDFGTGYSSLSYLQSFPFDKIKIDRSFISNLEATPQSAEIVRAVLSLAHALNIPVIAEGVETEAQRAFLAREACEEMQGYLVGRPDLIERYLDLVGVTVERRLYA